MNMPTKAMLFVLMVLVFCGVSIGEVYKVGDSAGWTDIDRYDYKSWSASKKFRVGDSIVFKYNKQFSNVVRVTHKNFNACNATRSYVTYNTGNDTFVIRKTGHFYFISSTSDHCQHGQKVDIRVLGPTKKSPSPSPSSSPSASPSPLEPITPSSTRAPSPSPAAGDNISGSSEMFFSFKLWLSMLLVITMV